MSNDSSQKSDPNSQEKLIGWNHYITAYSVALGNLRLLREVLASFDSSSPPTTTFSLHFEARGYKMVAEVFAAVTLESFINSYGQKHFSKNYFKNHLDRLSFESKWIVIPKLVTGKEINSDGQACQLIKESKNARDAWMHQKQSSETLSEFAGVMTDLTPTERCVQAVELAVAELKSIDSSIDEGWVTLTKSNKAVVKGFDDWFDK